MIRAAIMPSSSAPVVQGTISHPLRAGKFAGLIMKQDRGVRRRRAGLRVEKAGGAEGNRTPDLCSAIAALSHLSYSPAPIRRPLHGRERRAERRPDSDARRL